MKGRGYFFYHPHPDPLPSRERDYYYLIFMNRSGKLIYYEARSGNSLHLMFGTRRMFGSVKTSFSSVLVEENSETTAP